MLRALELHKIYARRARGLQNDFEQLEATASALSAAAAVALRQPRTRTDERPSDALRAARRKNGH